MFAWASTTTAPGPPTSNKPLPPSIRVARDSPWDGRCVELQLLGRPGTQHCFVTCGDSHSFLTGTRSIPPAAYSPSRLRINYISGLEVGHCLSTTERRAGVWYQAHGVRHLDPYHPPRALRWDRTYQPVDVETPWFLSEW